MKVRYKLAILLSSLLIFFLCWDLVWRWHGYKSEVDAILGGPGQCGVNTFNDRVSSAELRYLYRWSTERVENKFGAVTELYGEDMIGYPSASKSWHLPNGETLTVRLYEGNDSRGLWVRRSSHPLAVSAELRNIRPASPVDLHQISGAISWWDSWIHRYHYHKNQLSPGP